MPNFGYVYSPERIAAAGERMQSAGFQVSFAADRPNLKGWWKTQQSKGRHIIAAQQDEMKLNGRWRDPNSQSRGTCVGQGSSRAIEDVHISRLVDKAFLGVYTQIAYEPMYGYERFTRWSKTQPWGSQGECNDGLCGADAAAFYTTIGVVPRKDYSGVAPNADLSKPNEKLAIDWNNIGVPKVLIAAAAFHKIICHSSDNWDDYGDAISAKYWGHICLSKCFGLNRVIVGPYGTVEPDSDGGHDTECCGIVTLPNGETAFLIQQSWSANGPKYPPVIQVMGPNGEAVSLTMRPGSYCVRKSVLEGIPGGQERISTDIPAGSRFG